MSLILQVSIVVMLNIPLQNIFLPIENVKKTKKQNKVQPQLSKIVLKKMKKSNTELDYLAATV